MKKLKVLFASMLALVGVGALSSCRAQTQIVVKAEETTEVAEVAENVEEEDKSWWRVQWETYVAPLLTGISITSVVSVAFSIIFTIARKTALDKKYAEKDSEYQAKVADFEQKVHEALDGLNERMQEVDMIKGVAENILNACLNEQEVNEATKAMIKETMEVLTAKVDENNVIVQKYQKIEPILQLLVQLEIKLAKSNKNNIANGVIDDIEEISKLIKSL